MEHKLRRYRVKFNTYMHKLYTYVEKLRTCAPKLVYDDLFKRIGRTY
jgi:hypothetical protein